MDKRIEVAPYEGPKSLLGRFRLALQNLEPGGCLSVPEEYCEGKKLHSFRVRTQQIGAKLGINFSVIRNSDGGYYLFREMTLEMKPAYQEMCRILPSLKPGDFVSAKSLGMGDICKNGVRAKVLRVSNVTGVSYSVFVDDTGSVCVGREVASSRPGRKRSDFTKRFQDLKVGDSINYTMGDEPRLSSEASFRTRVSQIGTTLNAKFKIRKIEEKKFVVTRVK